MSQDSEGNESIFSNFNIDLKSCLISQLEHKIKELMFSDSEMKSYWTSKSTPENLKMNFLSNHQEISFTVKIKNLS